MQKAVGNKSKYEQIARDRVQLVAEARGYVQCAPTAKKTLALRNFIAEYNATRSILRDILGNVAKSTLYGWIRDYQEGGVEALMPHYGKPPKITEQEKKYLESILAQDHIRTGNAIHVMKFLAKRDAVKSASSVSTIRRWIMRYRHGDGETRRRGDAERNDG